MNIKEKSPATYEYRTHINGPAATYHTEDELIIDKVSTLDTINYQIAELIRIKEELESRLQTLLHHSENQSKTYICGKYKVVLNTGWNYAIDKEEYNIYENKLAADLNPVKKVLKYELDKEILRNIERYASEDDMLLLSNFLSKKPKKLHVAIKAAV